MQCIDPPIIENGKYKLNSEENDFPVTGSSAFYTCNVGYELMNDSVSSLVCALNKTDNSAYWLGEVPVCIGKVSVYFDTKKDFINVFLNFFKKTCHYRMIL